MGPNFANGHLRIPPLYKNTPLVPPDLTTRGVFLDGVCRAAENFGRLLRQNHRKPYKNCISDVKKLKNFRACGALLKNTNFS